MKKTKQLMAAVLAVCIALTLTGCFSSEDSSPGHESSKPSASAGSGGSGGENPIHGDTSLLDKLTLPDGSLDIESKQISEQDNEKIQRALEEMENMFLADPNGVEVKQREWSRYSSPLGKEPLTNAEADFYDRLDAYCLDYLKSANLNGTKSAGIDDEYRVGKSVPYSDLGLTAREAGDVYRWFLYNCPQYYFFRAGYSYTNTVIIPYMYARWSDGGERAEVTNELFDKLDSWIDLVGENTGTTYQKEYVANSYICDTVTYDYDSIKPGHESELGLNQSLYTAVVPENTVCAGYSKLFTAMMNALDVPVTGAVSSGHAWNVILLDDGNYYCVDTCWNAGGNKTDYLNVGDAASKKNDGDRESHVYREPEAKWIPAIAAENYQPTEYDTTGKKVSVDPPDGIRITLLDDEERPNGINIEWDAVEGASKYEFAMFTSSSHLELETNSKGEVRKTTEDTHMKVWNLKPEKIHYYGVRAIKTVDGKDYYSDWNYFSERLDAVRGGDSQLDKPTGLTVTPNQEDPSTKAIIKWDAVAGAEQYEFILFQDGMYDEVWKSWPRTSPSMSIKNLKPEKTYYYGVRAVKTTDDGDYSSNLSYGFFCLDDLAANGVQLSKPANFAAAVDPDDPDQCVFSWDAVEGAEKYRFALFTDETYQTIMTSSSGKLYSWDEEDLEIVIGPFDPDEMCYCGVQAVKTVDGKEVCSDWTYLMFQFDSLAGKLGQLAKPENLMVTKDEENAERCIFTWDAVQGAEQYQFARFTDNTYQTIMTSSKGELQSWDANGTSISLKPFRADRTYHYGVRAVKTVDGQKVFSDWAYTSFTFK